MDLKLDLKNLNVEDLKAKILQVKQINKNDYFIWEITYLNRTGFRLSHDHHFYTKNKENPKIKHNFHLSKTFYFTKF